MNNKKKLVVNRFCNFFLLSFFPHFFRREEKWGNDYHGCRTISEPIDFHLVTWVQKNLAKKYDSIWSK